MKDVLMITHFTQTPGENGNARFDYLAKLLSADNNVELVTTSFSHRTKTQRVVTDAQRNALPYKLTMLFESGYQKNVSPKRFLSHHRFARSLKKYLKTRKKPDLVYCGVPSLDAAAVASKYAKTNGIPLVIDIQDLWPEAFKMVINLPVVSDMIFFPMKKSADRIYSRADFVFAVSDTYVDRALTVNNAPSKAIYLGTELAYFDKLRVENPYKREDDAFLIGYAGTLGHSYDIKSVIDAIELLNRKDGKQRRFLVMGDGPLRQRFEEYASQKNVDAIFTGRVPYGEMVGMLCECDMCVNPIIGVSAASIINKHSDYAASGIPVINTQASPEYRALVDEYKMGINVANGDASELASAIERLENDVLLRDKMGANARRCAEERFDRAKTYGYISRIIASIGASDENITNKP